MQNSRDGLRQVGAHSSDTLYFQFHETFKRKDLWGSETFLTDDAVRNVSLIQQYSSGLFRN